LGFGSFEAIFSPPQPFLKRDELGHRTELDAEAERREIHQHRFTSLDRILPRTAEPVPDATEYLMVRAVNRAALGRRQHSLAARLAVLENMGLAQRTGPDSWGVHTDFEVVLRAMQRTNDRQPVVNLNKRRIDLKSALQLMFPVVPCKVPVQARNEIAIKTDFQLAPSVGKRSTQSGIRTAEAAAKHAAPSTLVCKPECDQRKIPRRY
jgi:hypothetical protein